MGNEVFPARTLNAARKVFHCQFPFPSCLSAEEIFDGAGRLSTFDAVIVNSQFTKAAYIRALGDARVDVPVHVVYPPVGTKELLARDVPKEPLIVSIGRFADRGHTKRHDVIIRALKNTSERFRSKWRLVLCGSVPSSPEARSYLSTLRELADETVSVQFIVSPSISELRRLLSCASAYVHATGFGVRADDEGSLANTEHFGIALVEAIAAGCQTFAYEVGGPAEIFDILKTGVKYSTLDELTALMESLEVGGLPSDVRHRVVEHFGDVRFGHEIRRIMG